MDFLSTKKLLSNEDAIRFSNIIFDDLLNNFTNDIMSIYFLDDNMKSSIHLQEIIKIPWIFCKIYSAQKENGYKWSDSSYDAFATTSRRLFEFTLNILLINNTCLNNCYLEFDHKKYNDLIDFYFKNNEVIENRGFKIVGHKSKNHVDYIDSICKTAIKYPPKDIIRSLKKLTNPLKQFLKMNEYTERIYNGDDSNNLINGRNPKGQWGLREKYETGDTDFTQILIKKKRGFHSVEEMVEDTNKGNFSSSPLLNNASKDILGFTPASENNQFKRIKIARAISANIGKINQNLTSDYKVPDRKLFSEFLKKEIISKNMDFGCNLFLSSLLLGINYEKLIRVMTGMDDSIVIDFKKCTLSIQLNSSIFAKNSKAVEVYAKKIKSTQKIITQLPKNIIHILKNLDKQIAQIIKQSTIINEEINILFKKLQIVKEADFSYGSTTSFQFKKIVENHISNILDNKTIAEISSKLTEISFLDSFFNSITKEFNEFLKKKISHFPKKIVIQPNKLPHIHKVYLNHQYPDISTERLFFSQISKSEEVKMCYTSMPATYSLQKDWYMKLQNYLEIKETIHNVLTSKNNEELKDKNKNDHKCPELIIENTVVGSPFFIQSGKSKNFFLSLLNAINSAGLAQVIKDNIRMIYIRYALSFLLGTRDFHQSCDLHNYSKAYKITTIQEKAKDARSSKRIIPLCKTAEELINIFHHIKDKYNYEQHTPCLIIKEESKIIFETMTQNNIIAWINNNDLNIDIDFIKNVPQNYGRHVIKSSKLNSKIKDEFIDALLNHHSSGTEDQGLFSTFSNKTYMREMNAFLEDIATEYLPKYGTENLR